MSEPRFTITQPQEDQEIAAFQAQDEQARQNGEWLRNHWAELLPQARGKFLAVAGQQSFLAETLDEAWRLARAAHPHDRGILVQYVRSERGPRLYANRV